MDTHMCVRMYTHTHTQKIIIWNSLRGRCCHEAITGQEMTSGSASSSLSHQRAAVWSSLSSSSVFSCWLSLAVCCTSCTRRARSHVGVRASRICKCVFHNFILFKVCETPEVFSKFPGFPGILQPGLLEELCIWDLKKKSEHLICWICLSRYLYNSSSFLFLHDFTWCVIIVAIRYPFHTIVLTRTVLWWLG